MRKTTKVTGTKIAQAAKDLNVTSVTIRRYISEFGLETTTDENGIKVLPDAAMSELQEVRRLKEEGLTNPQVLEFLEERRTKGETKADAKPEKEKPKATRKSPGKTKEKEVAPAAADEDEEEEAEEVEEEEEAPKARPDKRRASKKTQVQEEEEQEEETAEATEDEDESSEAAAEAPADGRLKHALTCQTCGKSFEHMNPRLRDCLDCYRAKRKERRRGGDRHKNVIQHPLAQQVVSKMANQQQEKQQEKQQEREVVARREPAPQQQRREREPVHHTAQNLGVTQPVIGGLKTQVRSYRKAIEETRQITGSLKRRLERPDLPEGDRRWLEQIYAYQLILHQGWRHLSEYRATTQQQNKQED